MQILAKKIISDEARFDLEGYVNKQNCRIWGTENPHAYTEKPTHPKRVTLWCEFWSKGIIGSYFFENEQGVTVTVNGDRYRAILNEFLFTKTFGCNRTALRATHCPVFEDRVISRRADVVWPPRSCVGLLFMECRQR